jgi:tRNA modification GTPase
MVVQRCFTPWIDVRCASLITGHMRLAPPIGLLPGDLFFWPNERSYTRQPTAEFHTFGSPPLLAAAVQTFCDQGARPAEPGEFTLRAFLAGRLDLTQAEAVLGVIDAAGRKPLEAALIQLAGGVSRPLSELREKLLELLSHLEAGLDFVDEDIEFISGTEVDLRLAEVERSVETVIAQLGSRVASTELPRVVLFGLPNVGKSSLFNALVGCSAAIVSPHAGTTRDYLTASIDLNGVACELVDTAGTTTQLRDRVSQAAQDATANQRETAQLGVLCLDSTRRLEPVEHEWLQLADERPFIRVLTKSDEPAVFDDRGPAIATSSRCGQGIEELASAIRQAISATKADTIAGTAERCYESLRWASESLGRARELNSQRAGEELIALELRLALTELGKVVGTVYTDDILDRIFSRFCIGK